MTLPDDWTEQAVHDACAEMSADELREFRHLLAGLLMVVDLAMINSNSSSITREGTGE